MRLVKLEELKDIKPFDCGDEDLNGFFYDDAAHYQKEMIANTFVMEDDNVTVAYFSLLNDKISQTTIARNLWRKLRKSFPHEKHLGSYPAVKIGRLAVSVAYKGQGIGTDIVSAVKQMLVNSQTVSACRFLTVDAYKEAMPFYLKNGFKLLVNDVEEEDSFTVPMYYDLKELAQ